MAKQTAKKNSSKNREQSTIREDVAKLTDNLIQLQKLQGGILRELEKKVRDL